MNTPLKPALALMLLLSTASCSVSRHVVSETHEMETVQEVHSSTTLTNRLDSLAEDITLQLDTVEIVIHDTITVIKAAKVTAQKQSAQLHTELQQVIVRDTVYVERTVESSTEETTDTVSAAKPPNLTLILIAAIALLLIVAILYKKLLR